MGGWSKHLALRQVKGNLILALLLARPVSLCASKINRPEGKKRWETHALFKDFCSSLGLQHELTLARLIGEIRPQILPRPFLVSLGINRRTKKTLGTFWTWTGDNPDAVCQICTAVLPGAWFLQRQPEVFKNRTLRVGRKKKRTTRRKTTTA